MGHKKNQLIFLLPHLWPSMIVSILLEPELEDMHINKSDNLLDTVIVEVFDVKPKISYLFN